MRVVMLTNYGLDEYVFEVFGRPGQRLPAQGHRACCAAPGHRGRRGGGTAVPVRDPHPDRRVRCRAPDRPPCLAGAPHPPRTRGHGTGRCGCTNEEIAGMVISPFTAKTHISRAMTKLGARDLGPTGGVRLRVGLGDGAGECELRGARQSERGIASSCRTPRSRGAPSGQCRKGSEIRRHMNSPADDTEIAIAIDPRLLVLVPATSDGPSPGTAAARRGRSLVPQPPRGMSYSPRAAYSAAQHVNGRVMNDIMARVGTAVTATGSALALVWNLLRGGNYVGSFKKNGRSVATCGVRAAATPPGGPQFTDVIDSAKDGTRSQRSPMTRPRASGGTPARPVPSRTARSRPGSPRATRSASRCTGSRAGRRPTSAR